MAKTSKREALSVSRLINEVLVSQLCIPFRQIVNDTTFTRYTGAKRPDILISEYEYDGFNDVQYIENVVAYAEVKDNCAINDNDWKDAIKQGKIKADKLNLPYFIVTNCNTAYFYNAKTLIQLNLNGNPIREFQTIDIYRLIIKQLRINPDTDLIKSESNYAISESIFNKKLWELANVYRGINFKNNIQKIDFTIGFVALEYFEEKEEIDGTKDLTKVYWSSCNDMVAEKIKNNLVGYINRLESETTFYEFRNVMGVVRSAINGDGKSQPLVGVDDIMQIYNIIDTMKPLHNTGFDLFGAVYEMFASTKEKKEFGEYFTRRHYACIFAKLLLKDESFYDDDSEFSIIDPACGTGGFLTESFKVLKEKYAKTDTLNEDAMRFISQNCFFGIDIRDENISRTRLNMFLVGDGHTHIHADNTLRPASQSGKSILDKTYKYVITNPPYGNGTIKAKTASISSNRYEIAFICKIIELLKVGGKACVIIPDGVFENPSYKKLRIEILEKCDVYAIVSLPKFAFAPYTKEKTYAMFLQKRSDKMTKIQSKSIWMYIIDNDGLANSDKRFPTRLRNNRNGWMHDEISEWVSTSGDEMSGLLESRWLTFDDLSTGGTQWINEKGITEKQKKGGFVSIDSIVGSGHHILLPEYHIRPYERTYIDKNGMTEKLNSMNLIAKSIRLSSAIKNIDSDSSLFKYSSYQAKSVPIKNVIGYMSGNSGLTEEFIYQTLQLNGEKYAVLSSATEEHTMMGKVAMCHLNNKPLKVFVGRDGLLVTRNGKAGRTRYLQKGKYTINDHAYILFVKASSAYKISLRWLAIQYQSEFLSYTSSSDNGTWNMTGFFNNVKIDIPDIKEQRKIVKLYAKIEQQLDSAMFLQNELTDILNRQLLMD